MSFVIAAPDMVRAAATDLANIGSTISEANAAAAAPTTGVLAAAGDEVSAAIAALFSGHGQAFQALSSQAADFHGHFVQNMTSGGRVQDVLQALRGAGFGAGVRGATGGHVPYELPVKGGGLGAQRLERLPVPGEQRRNGRRHLIAGRREHTRRRGRRGRIGGADRRTDIRQIGGRSHHHFGGSDHKRHLTPSVLTMRRGEQNT